jgi:two-component system nitrate/nitrite response regulator NarL
VTISVLPSEVVTTVFVGFNQLFEEGLTRLLGERLNIIKNIRTIKDALTHMQSNDQHVDLIIADPGPQKAVEFAAISEISDKFPETKLVVLTSKIDHAILEMTTQNGAVGVLSNDISTTALLYSIEIVLLGERIAPIILQSPGLGFYPVQPSELSRASKLVAALSTREEQILHCLVEGLPNKLIARNLDISEPTVKVHLRMLLRKLQLENRTQAAMWALNSGFSQNDETPVQIPHLGPGSMNAPMTAQFEPLGLSSPR